MGKSVPLSIRGRAKCWARTWAKQSPKLSRAGDGGASGPLTVRRKVAGRQLSGFSISSSPWRAERVPAGLEAMSSESAKPKVAGRQLGRPLFVMALLLPVPPETYELSVTAFNDDLAGEGHGKRVSRGIWMPRQQGPAHEVVIITKHEGARSSSWWERLKMEVVCTARGSQEVAHLDFELM